MARDEHNLQAPLLDRLVDLEPGVSREPVQHRLLKDTQVRALVARDLERLLNTRRRVTPVPAAFRHLENSLFTYGLKDFTARNPQSPAVRRELCRDIEAAIERFEPRLQNVSVQLDKVESGSRELHFRISALLVVEPLREPITFDTFFDLNRGDYLVHS